MQALARTSTAGTAYSAAQVGAMLTSPVAQEVWRFYLVTLQGRPLADITNYVDRVQPAVVEHDSTRAVQRLLTVVVRKDANLGSYLDLIQPHYQILAPDGGYIDFTLGVFGITKIEPTVSPGVTWQKVSAADLGQLLSVSTFATAHAVAAGQNIVTAIRSIIAPMLGTGNITLIPDRGKVVPSAIGWKAGDPLLTAVSDLLASMAYTPPSWDENGILRSDSIPDYSRVQPAFTFDATAGASIVHPNIQGDTVDVSTIPNIVRVNVEDPSRPAFSVTYTNNNPASSISVPNSFPRMSVISDSTLTDIGTAQTRAFAEAQKAAQGYATCTVSTLPWPVSQNLDVYRVVYANPDEGTQVRTYLETAWKMECAPGAKTEHTWQRVVPV